MEVDQVAIPADLYVNEPVHRRLCERRNVAGRGIVLVDPPVAEVSKEVISLVPCSEGVGIRRIEGRPRYGAAATAIRAGVRIGVGGIPEPQIVLLAFVSGPPVVVAFEEGLISSRRLLPTSLTKMVPVSVLTPKVKGFLNPRAQMAWFLPVVFL